MLLTLNERTRDLSDLPAGALDSHSTEQQAESQKSSVQEKPNSTGLFVFSKMHYISVAAFKRKVH